MKNNPSVSPHPRWLSRFLPRLGGAGLLFLLIGFLDELTFGAAEAAWPLVRSDLGLGYAEIGLLMGVPLMIGSLVEPVLGMFGDTGRRKAIMLAGGAAVIGGWVLFAAGPSLGVLFLAMLLLVPASGAFVSLSQAALVDSLPGREEQAMARWTLAGSIGVVAGPLLLSGLLAAGGGWRWALLVCAAFGLLLWIRLAAVPVVHQTSAAAPPPLREVLRDALSALRSGRILRWLTLLLFADFMLDVLLGFLALYFVDGAGFPPAAAGLAVAVWSGCGLISDALVIPLLERIKGLPYLRISALVMLILYPAFLLLPWPWAKLILVGLIGFCNAGWYAIPQAQVYSALPGRSGTAMAVTSLMNSLAGAVPFLMGMIAERFGLGAAMWLLTLGPVALLIGIPRNQSGILRE